MANTESAIRVGDEVIVLRAARLPREEALGRGRVARIEPGLSGQLFWISGFLCARTAREIRRAA